MGQENKTKQESKGEKKGYSTSNEVKQIVRQNTDIAEGINRALLSPYPAAELRGIQ